MIVSNYQLPHLHYTDILSVDGSNEDSIVVVFAIARPLHAHDPLPRLPEVRLSRNRDPLLTRHHEALNTHRGLIHIIWLKPLDTMRRDHDIVSFSHPVCLRAVGRHKNVCASDGAVAYVCDI